MAQHHGYTTVITVSAEEAEIWIIAYTIIITSSFEAVAKLVTSLVLAYAELRGRGNRHVMLAAFYNTDSQLTAACQMVQYAWRAVRKCRLNGKWAVNRDTLHFALILISVATANLLVAQTAKILLGRQLVVRNAARVNPDKIYYPTMIQDKRVDIFQLLQPLRATAAFQAVGRVEASKTKLGEKVKLNSTLHTSNNGPTLELHYSYSITGEDLGLQLAHFLVYSVTGNCTTKYDWLRQGSPSSQNDVYDLWGPPARNNDTVPVDEEAGYQPWIRAFGDPEGVDRSLRGEAYQFAFVPHTSSRVSTDPKMDDPWYLTEPNQPLHSNGTVEHNQPNFPHRVKRRRPPISCWQKDTFALGKNKVDHVGYLNKLHGLQLSPFLRDLVLPLELGTPPIIQITGNLGYSSTSASLYALPYDKAINTTRCNATADLERLLQISYVSSREIVRNTALLFFPFQKDIGQPNAAGTGKVLDQNADFILESKDVAALSVPVLLSAPCMCLFLWILVLFRTKYRMVMAKNTGRFSRHNLRLVGFQASQLYRYLDEQISGENRWSGRRTLTPFIRDIEKDRAEMTNTTEEFLPVSVAGTGAPSGLRFQSPFVRPKLVKIPSSHIESTPDFMANEVDHDPKIPLISTKALTAHSRWMFWRKMWRDIGEKGAYEMVMTRHWDSKVKVDDGYVYKKEINDNV